MAKAQLENGYTKIANELLEKACSTQLNTNEFRVFFAIVRLSYGWNQKTTANRASGNVLAEMTRLRIDKVYAAIKSLKCRRIIEAQATKAANEYKINTDIEKWSNRPKSGIPKSGIPKSGCFIDPSQGKNNPKSGCFIDPSQVYATSATSAPEAADQTPKEIKEIKERKESEILPSDYYQKTLKALGLPSTGIISPKDHTVLIALLKDNCNVDDIEQARIKRKKNKLEWIQDTVCEMRDARLATVAKPDHNGIPILPSGCMDWDNMTFKQKQFAIQRGYEK